MKTTRWVSGVSTAHSAACRCSRPAYHDDVGADGVLQLDGFFWGEHQLASVVRGLELDALLNDWPAGKEGRRQGSGSGEGTRCTGLRWSTHLRHVGELEQRHHLEPAAVLWGGTNKGCQDDRPDANRDNKPPHRQNVTVPVHEAVQSAVCLQDSGALQHAFLRISKRSPVLHAVAGAFHVRGGCRGGRCCRG